MGYEHTDGCFYILDRLKDMIVTGGENVYCGEGEAVILSHPAVREVAVLGIPDSQWGSGARPLKRTIERLLVQPLPNLMATDQIQRDDHIRVTYSDGSRCLTCFRQARALETRGDLRRAAA